MGKRAEAVSLVKNRTVYMFDPDAIVYINGQVVKTYDINSDEFRPLTAGDLAGMGNAVARLGTFLHDMRMAEHKFRRDTAAMAATPERLPDAK